MISSALSASSISSLVAPAATVFSVVGSRVAAFSRHASSSTSAPTHGQSYSLPPEVLRCGGLGLLGCSPRFFRKWMEFQFAESGRRFTWENRGLEWDYARADFGLHVSTSDDSNDCFEDEDEDAEFELGLQEYERAAYSNGENGRRASVAFETGHWSSFYPRRKSSWDDEDALERARVVRRFLALHVYHDVRGTELYDGVEGAYKRDDWIARSLMK